CTPPRPTPTLFPYPTLFRSDEALALRFDAFVIGDVDRDPGDDRPLRARAAHPPARRDPADLARSRDDSMLDDVLAVVRERALERSEEHTSELQSRENLVCRL